MSAIISLVIAILFVAGGLVFFKSTQTTQEGAPSTTSQGTELPSSAETSLVAVDRSGQGLTKMPSEILAMTSVQQLDLSNNALTGALPAEIRHLSNLQVLNISNNKMTGLPAELGQLSKLRILNASNNQLTGIPHELGNLQNLEILNLSGNNISEFDLNEIRKKLPASTQITL